MKKLLIIALLIVGSVYGTVINVPDDYATIQEGIDAAIDTDTVLVAQGAYYENLTIYKNITLTSNAIYDDLSVWAEYSLTFGQYELLNDNIENTVINGSLDTNGEDLQSVIYINSPDECIEPVVFGFTITGGDGTLVTYMEEGNEIQERRGGGFYSNNALPEIHYNYIHDNNGTGLSPIHSGGGTDIDLNERCEGDIDLSYNFYRDNDALYGNTLATNGYAGSLDMSNSIFDVYNCPEEEVTPVWVDVEEEVEVDFQYSAGDLCSIIEDVWVSPDGDDYLNTGTSESNAFKTIEVALALIAPDSLNTITINLTEGIFSPSTTGENFSIIMISNVNLIGQGEEVTIIDAEQTGRVIIMEDCENNTISELTLTGGLGEGDYPDDRGGGMRLWYSDPILTHVTISNNTAEGSGGGIYLTYSNPILTHVTISDNTSEFIGGGMTLFESNPTLTHVTIINNTSGGGGGMYLYESDPILTNVTISGNTANDYGGGMFLDSSNPILTHVTISDNTSGGGGGMYLWFSDPTLTDVTFSNNEADVWGGGLFSTFSNPTLTNVIINENISESGGGGIVMHYSNPILIDVIISGNKVEEGIGGGIYAENSDATLTNATINDNRAERGGGIYLKDHSNCIISHSIIRKDTAIISGGGIMIENSDPTLLNVTISDNESYQGGGLVFYHSDLTLSHMTISGNQADYWGGMFLQNSNINFINSIIWNNTPEIIYLLDSEININYSNIVGDTTWTGEGNINVDPLFADPENDDYTLQEGSPCIDTGIVIEDMEYCGTAPDMGAYEYCQELSVASETHMPIHYSLNAAYPNPFNPVTSIAYSLPQNGNFELTVYNIQGRQIETLINDFQTSGYHSINWNATSYPSGVYLIRMESGEFTQTQKVVLVK